MRKPNRHKARRDRRRAAAVKPTAANQEHIVMTNGTPEAPKPENTTDTKPVDTTKTDTTPTTKTDAPAKKGGSFFGGLVKTVVVVGALGAAAWFGSGYLIDHGIITGDLASAITGAKASVTGLFGGSAPTAPATPAAPVTPGSAG